MVNVKLKIVKCNSALKWYANLVGQYVPLLGIGETEYKSREPEGYINFVSKEDAVIVTGNKDLR